MDLDELSLFDILMEVLSDIPTVLILLIKEYHFIFEGVFVCEWGQTNDGNNLYLPTGLENDGDYLYICDCRNNRIQIRNKVGGFVSHFDSHNVIRYPTSLVIHNSYLYLTNNYDVHGSIQIFSLFDGQFINEIQCESFCSGLAIYNSLIYVSCYTTHLIKIFSLEGLLMGKFGHNGEKEARLKYPCSVQIDQDLIYVADSGNNRIVIYNIDHSYKTHWYGNKIKYIKNNKRNRKKSKLYLPYGLLIIDDYVFVGSKWLSQYDKEGYLIKRWGGDGILGCVIGITFFDGKIIISDSSKNRLLVLK